MNGTDHYLHCITPIIYEDTVIRHPKVVVIGEDEYETIANNLNTNCGSIPMWIEDMDCTFFCCGMRLSGRQFEKNDFDIVCSVRIPGMTRFSKTKWAPVGKNKIRTVNTHVVTTANRSCSWMQKPISIIIPSLWFNSIFFHWTWSSIEEGSLM